MDWYKSEIMRVAEPGIWRGKHYAHILPTEHAQENILPAYRDAFWRYQQTSPRPVPLHQYFHHLNSSQALAINLFFPIVMGDEYATKRLLKACRLPAGKVKGEFEVVFDHREKTTFDFVLTYDDGRTVLFEVKYSENGFGTAPAAMWEAKYRTKFEEHYRPHLQGHIDERWLDRKSIQKHYQILRNVTYVSKFARKAPTTVVFVAPYANEALTSDFLCIADIANNLGRTSVDLIDLQQILEELRYAPIWFDRSFDSHSVDLYRKYHL